MKRDNLSLSAAKASRKGSLYPGGQSNKESPVVLGRLFRVAVLGAEDVGKTAFIEKFVDGSVRSKPVPTIEDIYETHLQNTEGYADTLHIIDTAGGAEPTPGIRKHWIKRAHGFILVYSVTSEESFKFVRELRKEIVDLRGKEVPTYIVATKPDLGSDRKVDTTDGQTWASMFQREGVVGFCEVSLESQDAQIPFLEVVSALAKTASQTGSPSFKLVRSISQTKRKATLIPPQEVK
eukprot:Colp12_sorted_trinity150504_noHs@14130